MAQKKEPLSDEMIVGKAYRLFNEFHRSLDKYHKKCEANEEFWKANADYITPDTVSGEQPPKPTTPTLFSTLESTLSDLMDYYPEATLLPQGPEDAQIADQLNLVVKAIHQKADYKPTYRDKTRELLVCGTSVEEIYWDNDLYNGLGDIRYRKIPVRNFMWDPLVKTVQDGRACFKFDFYHKSWFKQRWPDKDVRPGGASGVDDDDSGRSYANLVEKDGRILYVEYWYKEEIGGKTVVQMAKIGGGTLLEHSKDTETGYMYAHGLYPFIMEPLYAIDDCQYGFGLVDIFGDTQKYADEMDQIILKNARMASVPKVFVNEASGILDDDIRDWKKEIIKGNRVGNEDVRWFETKPLPSQVLTMYNQKLQQIKEESGQNEFARGEGGKGVTAASAITALQEASNKRSRMIREQTHDTFKRHIRMTLEFIAEFYTEGRTIRLLNNEVTFRGDLMRYTVDNPETGTAEKGRIIDFDINIETQPQSPFQKMQFNEMMLQFAQLQVISPRTAVSMMYFERKDEVLALAEQDDKTKQQIVEMQQIIEQQAAQLEQLGQQAQQQAQQMSGIVDQQVGNALGGSETPQNAQTASQNSQQMPM